MSRHERLVSTILLGRSDANIDFNEPGALMSSDARGVLGDDYASMLPHRDVAADAGHSARSKAEAGSPGRTPLWRPANGSGYLRDRATLSG